MRLSVKTSRKSATDVSIDSAKTWSSSTWTFLSRQSIQTCVSALPNLCLTRMGLSNIAFKHLQTVWSNSFYYAFWVNTSRSRFPPSVSYSSSCKVTTCGPLVKYVCSISKQSLHYSPTSWKPCKASMSFELCDGRHHSKIVSKSC